MLWPDVMFIVAAVTLAVAGAVVLALDYRRAEARRPLTKFWGQLVGFSICLLIGVYFIAAPQTVQGLLERKADFCGHATDESSCLSHTDIVDALEMLSDLWCGWCPATNTCVAFDCPRKLSAPVCPGGDVRVLECVDEAGEALYRDAIIAGVSLTVAAGIAGWFWYGIWRNRGLHQEVTAQQVAAALLASTGVVWVFLFLLTAISDAPAVPHALLFGLMLGYDYRKCVTLMAHHDTHSFLKGIKLIALGVCTLGVYVFLHLIVLIPTYQLSLSALCFTLVVVADSVLEYRARHENPLSAYNHHHRDPCLVKIHEAVAWLWTGIVLVMAGVAIVTGFVEPRGEAAEKMTDYLDFLVVVRLLLSMTGEHHQEGAPPRSNAPDSAEHGANPTLPAPPNAVTVAAGPTTVADAATDMIPVAPAPPVAAPLAAAAVEDGADAIARVAATLDPNDVPTVIHREPPSPFVDLVLVQPGPAPGDEEYQEMREVGVRSLSPE